MSKTIEEKAIAYDKAIEKAREYWETDDDNTLDIKARGTMEYLFPELVESEGERIRKEILEVAKTVVSRDGTLYGKKYNCREWIAWLEKQGKQKEYTFKSIPRLLDMIEPTSKAKAYCQKLINTLKEEGYNTDAKIVEEVLKGWNGENVPMAVMDEQKPADSFKPKFKVGDWVVNDEDGDVQQIIEIQRINEFIFYKCDNIFFNKPAEKYWRLWTINDAKPGDVLREDSCTFIIERMNPDGTAIVYCCLFDDGDFDSGSTLSFDIDSTKPATKEQRDFFFQKMKEKSYEWNAEKKELKKIKYRVCDEDKAEMDYCFTKMINGEKVSEEDEEYNGEDYGIDGLWHAMNILERTLGKVDGYQTDDGFLSHQCAITAIKKLYEQKSAK